MKKDVFQCPINLLKIERPKTCEVEYLDYNGKKQLLKAEA